MNRNIPTVLLITALMAGCNSAKHKGGKEYVLGEKQQRAFIAKTKEPQQFGFMVYERQNGSIALQGVAHQHPLHAASAGFSRGNAPVIKIAGKARRMQMNVLLDTGSSTSWMEYNSAREFGAIPLGLDGQIFPYQGNADTGAVNAFAAVVTQMRIDQLCIENIPLFVRMAANSLGPLNRGVYSPKVGGVLGYDVLGTFEYVQIDLAAGKVDFSATTPYTPNESLLMTAAKIVPSSKYGLAVEGAIFDDPTPIILDIAGNYHFESGTADAVLTEQVSLGEVVYLNVPTRSPARSDLPPRAGRLMLQKYIITICPTKGVVYFERPLA